MDTHFVDTITNRSAISEIAAFRGTNSRDNASFAPLVLQFLKPSIKYSRAKDRIHDTRVYLFGYSTASTGMSDAGLDIDPTWLQSRR
jgi:hypothetical protein